MKFKMLLKKKPFLNQNVIICGASKGIGKETAIKISQLGGNLCLIARGNGELETTAKECRSLKVSENQFVEIISCDTTQYDILKPLLEKFIQERGTPDYLINMVGFAIPKYIQDYTLDDYKHNMNVNYYSQLVPSMILIPHFIKEKRGHIANVSSMLGYMGIMGYGSYSPSKFAIVGWSEVARNELSTYNIKIPEGLYTIDTLSDKINIILNQSGVPVVDIIDLLLQM